MEETALGLKQVRDGDGCLVWQTTPEFERLSMSSMKIIFAGSRILMQWFLAKLPGKSLTLDIQTTAAAKTVDVTLVIKTCSARCVQHIRLPEVYTASSSREQQNDSGAEESLDAHVGQCLSLGQPMRSGSGLL